MKRLWLVAILLLLTSCAGTTRHTAEPMDYRPVPGTAQILVTYGTGTDATDIHAEVVSETATQVTIRITYRQSNGMHNDMLLIRTAALTLAAPLGSRKVVADTGAEVPAATPT